MEKGYTVKRLHQAAVELSMDKNSIATQIEVTVSNRVLELWHPKERQA